LTPPAATPVARDERFVLAVDLGTGGPKIGLVSLAGTIAWNDHCPVETRRLPDGGAVQDAAEWWDLILDAARRALASGTVDPSQIEAVSCTGQWASTVPVDESGIPVGDCQLWMDSRGEPHARDRGPVRSPVPLAVWSGAGSRRRPAPTRWSHAAPDARRADRRARQCWWLEPVDHSMRFTGVRGGMPRP
jgi:xylulokinase